jgi:prephenate dehydrogenase
VNPSESSSGESVGPVGVVGFGRFGQALCELLVEAGVRVQAWDPNVKVPDDLQAIDLQQLVAGASMVVLAVPVGEVRDTLGGLRPFLTAGHCVMDVGSVKHGPIAAMAETFGRDIPWVATHPLFGPSSIALGDRPLRAVVCPNDLHSEAVVRARALYERLGCEVIEQSADEHDQAMARTHAVAFFVAKGLIDIGASEGLAFTPPSFKALSQMIDTVRSDAGHLFLAIERGNPFAAAARRELLEALELVHDRLGDPEDPHTAEASAGLAIPDLGEQAPELRQTRDLIDELDEEIVGLLARRMQIVIRAGGMQPEDERAVSESGRERVFLDERKRWAGMNGLPEEPVAALFAAIQQLSMDIS